MRPEANAWPERSAKRRAITGRLALVLCILAFASNCISRHSPVGFRLPESGDIEMGRTAFVELECYRCHSVVGEDLPPTMGSTVPLILGGSVGRLKTDGYLVTSIIHPSHKFPSGLAEGQVAIEGESRMPDYTRGMTVRQLIDIVAFLQFTYRQAVPPLLYP